MYCINGASRSSLLIESTDSKMVVSAQVNVHLVLYAYIFIFCICGSKRNHAIAFERSIFSKSNHYKSFWCCSLFGIYMLVVAENYEQTDTHTHTHTRTHTLTLTQTHIQTHTHTHTHTWNNYCNRRCACTPKVNNYTQYIHVYA